MIYRSLRNALSGVSELKRGTGCVGGEGSQNSPVCLRVLNPPNKPSINACNSASEIRLYVMSYFRVKSQTHAT